VLRKVTLPELKNIHTIVFDFDGVFTNNKVWVDENGKETVRCDRSDGLGFDLLRNFIKHNKYSVEIFILSKEKNKVVSQRAKKLKIACHQGVSDKLKYLKQLLSKRFPNNKNYFAGLIYLGNDLNDFSVMDCAGFAVAPSDAHSKIIEIADIVYKERGGHGFIRAFIEDLLDIKKLSKEHIYELISYR
jgi:3-deoxy-D-manno-octulosonate 8-phosphate phosphatase (KDO 8-P phosphatase)